MFTRTLRIARIAGIPIEVDGSWFLVFVLIGGVLGFVYFPGALPGFPLWVAVAVGFVTSLLFAASLVFHELCHSLVAKRNGIGVARITLFLFGGVSELLEEPRGPGVEFVMSVAGPGASLGLAVALFAFSLLAPALRLSEVVAQPIQYLALINLILGIFNLAPGYPMDGGRVLHSYLWWALGDRLLATRIAAWAGRFMALSLIAIGILLFATSGLSGLWPVLLGLFLLRLVSQNFAMQAGGLRRANTRVDRAMTRPLPTVDAAARAGEVAAAAMQLDLPAVAVVSLGSVVGVLTVERAASHAPDNAGAAELALNDPVFFVDGSDSVDTALRRFKSGVPALVAVDDGRAVGLVTPESVAAATAPSWRGPGF
jgi:Zn-dependent protease